MTKVRGSVAVVGAGDFIGAAIARRFAAEGRLVHGGRRNSDRLATLSNEIAAAGGAFTGHTLDARDEASVVRFLDAAEADAPLEACVFNVGANVRRPLLETSERVFRKVWEMACSGGFLTGREEAAASLGPDVLMNPDSIADTYWRLHTQPRDAWTHELDLRPFGET